MIRLHVFFQPSMLTFWIAGFLILLKSCAELLSWKEQEEVSSSLGNSSQMIDTAVSLAVDFGVVHKT